MPHAFAQSALCTALPHHHILSDSWNRAAIKAEGRRRPSNDSSRKPTARMDGKSALPHETAWTEPETSSTRHAQTPTPLGLGADDLPQRTRFTGEAALVMPPLRETMRVIGMGARASSESAPPSAGFARSGMYHSNVEPQLASSGIDPGIFQVCAAVCVWPMR